MSDICIVHHLGLGDQIMLNGMVRHFAEKYTNVHIFVKNCHKDSVEFMYRDLKNIKFIYVDNTNPRDIWSRVPKCTVVPLATYAVPDNTWAFFTQRKAGNLFTNWAHGVYIQAGLNPKYMYSKFKVIRDCAREDNLYKYYNLQRDTYIFKHDDPARDRKITKIESTLQLFSPDSKPIDDRQEFFETTNPNIFDYIKIIENAKEVHCMNSSYNWMIDLMNIGDKSRNFFHTYAAHPYYTPRTVKTVFNDEVWTFVD